MNILIDEKLDIFDLLKASHTIVEEFSTNVDLIIQSSHRLSESTENKAKAHNIPVLGGMRLDKICQSIAMTKYNINHPKSWYVLETSRPLNSLGEIDAYVEDEEFIIKPINGARSIGVELINREKYLELLYAENDYDFDNVLRSNEESMYSKKSSIEDKTLSMDIEEKRPVRRREEDMNYMVRSFVRNHEMLFQRRIHIRKEYRVILTLKDSIAYEKIHKLGVIVGNIENCIATPKVLLPLKFASIINDFRKLMTHFNYPWLSIDLYEDTSGDVGCFEFQMEFVYKGFDPKDVKHLLLSSIEDYEQK